MATYIRLTDYKSSDEKEKEFFNSENRYEAKQEDFSKVPASPVAYWVSDKVISIIQSNDSVYNTARPRKGLVTLNDEQFLRRWYEVSLNDSIYNARMIDKSSVYKWFPITKGGETAKWYGNNNFLINWLNDGDDLKKYITFKSGDHYSRQIINEKYYLTPNITWNGISSGMPSFRKSNEGFVISSSGPSSFPDLNYLDYFLAFLNSKSAFHILKIFSQTLSFLPSDIGKLPIIFTKSELKKSQIDTLTNQCINISKEEWDSRETSWDFTKNELIKHNRDGKIETAYSNFCNYWKEQHNTLHQNEEELNRLFIDIYELQDELTPEVELKDITILNNETKIIDGALVFQADEIMKQFISYGVGVMFGRYSLESEGLLIANMGQEVPSSETFEIDDDNVIPVLEDDFFTDDIASRFTQFVKATFGEEDLNENINFIEKSLGTSIRKYFVKGFYEDHIKRYKKRPIYWMVSSPKKGFMTLIYMHRYTSDIFATIQNDYLREYIEKLENNIDNFQRIADDESNSNSDRTKATKEITKSNKILDEIIQFDRNSLTRFAQDGIEIDLDDGVKVNYCKFKDILYPISGLCK